LERWKFLLEEVEREMTTRQISTWVEQDVERLNPTSPAIRDERGMVHASTLEQEAKEKFDFVWLGGQIPKSLLLRLRVMALPSFPFSWVSEQRREWIWMSMPWLM
jgi:hypothetical protein